MDDPTQPDRKHEFLFYVPASGEGVCFRCADYGADHGEQRYAIEVIGDVEVSPELALQACAFEALRLIDYYRLVEKRLADEATELRRRNRTAWSNNMEAAPYGRWVLLLWPDGEWQRGLRDASGVFAGRWLDVHRDPLDLYSDPVAWAEVQVQWLE